MISYILIPVHSAEEFLQTTSAGLVKKSWNIYASQDVCAAANPSGRKSRNTAMIVNELPMYMREVMRCGYTEAAYRGRFISLNIIIKESTASSLEESFYLGMVRLSEGGMSPPLFQSRLAEKEEGEEGLIRRSFSQENWAAGLEYLL